MTLTNPGFETGDFTGWNNDSGCFVFDMEAHTGTYSCLLNVSGIGEVGIWQDVDLTGIESVSLWHMEYGPTHTLNVYVDSDLIYTTGAWASPWEQITTTPKFSYSGVHTLKIKAAVNQIVVDDITLNATPTPTDINQTGVFDVNGVYHDVDLSGVLDLTGSSHSVDLESTVSASHGVISSWRCEIG
jgi:hypothetical protein